MLTKSRKLNAFRRGLPHCSASALGAILQHIKDHGLPEGGLSRQALRLARNRQCHADTDFGPLLQSIDVQNTEGGILTFPVCNPSAFLWIAVTECDRFSSFMLARLHENPSTPEAPWTLLLYSDEVTPGNPLATLNNRKFHAVYWSFLELGENALSREEAWITIMVEYSKNINKVMAGLSQAMAQLIKLFFGAEGHSFATSGMLLPFAGGGIRLWARLGGML